MEGCIGGLVLLASGQAFGRTVISQLMERTALRIDQVEAIADQYFREHGTGQGSGYKHYQRWLHECGFHLDVNGYYIAAEKEDRAYHNVVMNMGVRIRASMPWSEMGPTCRSRTSGWNPGVGRITSLAIDPSDTNIIIYVTSPGGGIWKSTNGGSTRISLVDFVNSYRMNFFPIAIDPNNTSAISLSQRGRGSQEHQCRIGLECNRQRSFVCATSEGASGQSGCDLCRAGQWWRVYRALQA